MRRFATVLVTVTMLALVPSSPSQADDIAISAQILGGTRTITTATPPTIANVLRGATSTGSLVVTVTEAAIDGDASWSVTVRMCGPNGGGTAADCTADPDRLVKTGATTTKLNGSAFAIADRAVTPAGVSPGGTATPVSGSEDLSTTRTIFTNTGQDPGTLYTGTYASTSNITLTAPNQDTGTYTGYLVVTLVL